MLYSCLFKGETHEPFVEKAIHEFVFNNSNKDIRPELSHGVPTHVHFDMKLQKIVNLVRNIIIYYSGNIHFL